MEIENVAIDKLIQYEFNNKIHDDTQIDRIANSIKEFGFLQPIVIEQDNTIIVGHGRYLGAKKLGLKELPCVRVENLTDEQIKKNRIWDKFWRAKMSVCIIGKHNRRGGIECYIIQKKKEGRRNKRHTVKVYDHYGDFVDLKFETKDEALKRLDKQPVETILVSDELDFIVY